MRQDHLIPRRECPMNRDRMIETLVGATVESVVGDHTCAWLREILTKGFPGYEHMSIEALTREMQMRGLLEFDDPEPEEEFDDDEDVEDDEDAHDAMFATRVALDR